MPVNVKKMQEQLMSRIDTEDLAEVERLNDTSAWYS